MCFPISTSRARLALASYQVAISEYRADLSTGSAVLAAAQTLSRAWDGLTVEKKRELSKEPVLAALERSLGRLEDAIPLKAVNCFQAWEEGWEGPDPAEVAAAELARRVGNYVAGAMRYRLTGTFVVPRAA